MVCFSSAHLVEVFAFDVSCHEIERYDSVHGSLVNPCVVTDFGYCEGIGAI